MVMFIMFLLLIIPVLAGIEALLIRRRYISNRAVLAGIWIGGLCWNAYTYRPAFPILSLALLAFALLMLIWLIITSRPVITRGIITALVTAAALLIGWDGLLIGYVNQETVSDIQVMSTNLEGNSALIVYHAGGSEFQQRINTAFAEGLIANGWNVTMVTASSQVPTDLSGYDLLVLGTPTYNWGESSRPIQDYVRRLSSLNQLPTVAITSGAGYIAHAQLDELVTEAGGQVIRSIQIFTTAPNLARYGNNNQEEIMRREAALVAEAEVN